MTSLDHDDFASFLGEIGVTQAHADKVAERQAHSGMQLGERYYVAASDIHGLGVFAMESFDRSRQVCLLRKGTDWTLAGRYINHRMQPNCEARRIDNECVVVAKQNIRRGEEITLNYRQVKQALEE